MKNTLGETVKFNQDLNIKFDINLIDDLQVYNFSNKKFENCEHWGWNNEGENNRPFSDFGLIADFDFEISKTKTKFYFGDSPYIGYYEDNITKLFCLSRGELLPKNFITVGFFNFEKEYPVPKTMFDLANYIDNFLAERLKEVLIKVKNHKANFHYKPSKKNDFVNTEDLNDLPF